MKKHTFFDRLRLWPWLLGALLTTTVVGVIAPHQLGLLIWSLSKLCLGAYLGYWIDRGIFCYARPGAVVEAAQAAARQGSTDGIAWTVACWCMMRRAVIIAAAVLALGLGV
ncbi:putative holin [Bordetella petrii]|uniref:Phage-related membrane protein n=1 Tax=Bordetella petrii (strain ATCC BAA-461 / DSM 12804 / CCUG 43448 / CIP 107267 / Se-1111R) TaxID=340100 RepID=A9ID23_BORPD|nr:putative holin [Bordetella petrii]CAP44750.1 putative phage-related membrane protein [Bordetella petrii]